MRILLYILTITFSMNLLAKDSLISTVSVKEKIQKSTTAEDEFLFSWEQRKFRFFLAPLKKANKGENIDSKYAYGPVLEVTTDKSHTRILDLRDKFESYRFAKVFQDEPNQRIWILLEWCIEGPHAEYPVWISENGGDSWFRGGDLQRPSPRFPPSDIHHLWVDGQGHGEARSHMVGR